MDMVVVQVYAPTTDHPDEELEFFYDDVNKAMNYAKGDGVILVMGGYECQDWYSGPR